MSLTVKPGYAKTTTALKTASGKDSAARALDPKDSAVTLEDGTEIKIADAVTQYVLQDTAEKAAKESKEKSAAVVRAYTSTVRDESALSGDYQKTLRVLGKQVKKVQYAVDASQVDKFTAPKSKDDIEAIRTVMGPAFESVFEQTVELSIKKSVIENDTLRRELSQALYKALGVEGIRKYFEKEDTWRVKKGMAETQYSLSKTVRDALHTHTKPAADALKDASGTVE